MRRELPLEWQQVAASACESDTLWTRGLVADPSAHWQFVAQPEVAFFAPPGPPTHGVVYSGDVFTDGSKIGRCNVTAGVGWAAAQFDLRTCEIEFVRYGPMPVDAKIQVRILRAELWAVFQVLLFAMLPLTIHVDNATVVRGYARGREWCCCSLRPHADVWRLIWDRISDLGPEDGQLKLLKCKSHVSKTARLQMGPKQRAICEGNDVADLWAKEGAKQSDMDKARDQAYLHHEQQVKWALNFIASMNLKVVDWPAVEKIPRVDVRKRSRAVRPRKPCTRIRVAASRLQRCSRHGAYVKYSRHALMSSSSLLWCAQCGSYSEKRLAGMRRACPGKPRNASAKLVLRKLQCGKHTKFGSFIGTPRRVTTSMCEQLGIKQIGE